MRQIVRAILTFAPAVVMTAQLPAQTPGARPDTPPRANRSQPAQPALPPLSEDAQRLVDQWTLNQANIIEQLRLLQRAYRDDGRAEDAAAIAAQVRLLQPRPQRPSGPATADLANEGLPTRNEPVLMSLFRNRVGETLSFAIRGRDDQPIWGTTTYTDASALETAAVHAGLLHRAQSGIVRVRVLPGQESYDAAEQNGVQSQAYSRYSGSYRFVAASFATPVRTPSLSSCRDLVGLAITIPVVGSASGGVWGTDIYTDDSSPAAAAMHAGVISAGEFALVKVTLMPGQDHYDGSARYGVTSQPYEKFEGSFRVERALERSIVQLPGGEDASRLVQLQALRGHPGASFVVQVVGTSSGPVWGTGAYTDDSSIATAAVHAGLLEPGELGFLRVTIGPGQDSFTASESHGVKSQPYGPWEGSFRLERVTRP